MAKLIILGGVPGSGKSTYIKNNFPDYVKVCPDEIRVELLQKQEEHKGKIEGQLIEHLYIQENKVWFLAKHRTVNNLAKGNNVVFDAMSLNKKSRKSFFQWIAENNLQVEVCAVFLNVPLEKALEQNEKRGNTITGYDENNNPIMGRKVPEEVIREKYKHILLPTYEEGFVEVLIVNS